MDLRDDITEAINGTKIDGFEFARLTEYSGILDRIASRFLKKGTKDLDCVWMWNEFNEPVSSIQPDDPIGVLRSQLKNEEKYWFLASDESGKYWVAKSTKEALIKIIEEMYCFEYYISNLKMDWIVCENHHGVIIQSGANGIIESEQGDSHNSRGSASSIVRS